MPDERQLIEDARKLKTSAVAALFASEYPRIYRIACGMSGRTKAGRAITRQVFARAVHLLPKWDAAAHPEYWFRRYAVQLAREYSGGRPATARDVLVQPAAAQTPAYLAFIAAVRGMSDQQQEAILLHFGERFDRRDAARAMDCSTEAAANHFSAATDHLKLVAGEGFEIATQTLAQIYSRLTPEEQIVAPSVNRLVRRYVWPRKLWRLLVRLVKLAIIAAVLFGAWKLYQLYRSGGIRI